MKVEFLNQYTQVWEVDGHVQKDVVRTHKTLDEVKQDFENKSYITNGDWSYDGVVAVVYGNLVDNPHGKIEVVRTVAKGMSCDFGNKGYHALEEVLNSDLAYVVGYGFVEDRNDFKQKFEDVAQKK